VLDQTRWPALAKLSCPTSRMPVEVQPPEWKASCMRFRAASMILGLLKMSSICLLERLRRTYSSPTITSFKFAP
jgi:hypothetical protein